MKEIKINVTLSVPDNTTGIVISTETADVYRKRVKVSLYKLAEYAASAVDMDVSMLPDNKRDYWAILGRGMLMHAALERGYTYQAIAKSMGIAGSTLKRNETAFRQMLWAGNADAESVRRRFNNAMEAEGLLHISNVEPVRQPCVNCTDDAQEPYTPCTDCNQKKGGLTHE